jgi:hypothetical protein
LKAGAASACDAVDPCLYYPGRTAQENCTPLPLCRVSSGNRSALNGPAAAADNDDYTVWDSAPWINNKTLSVLTYDTGLEGAVVTRYRLQFAGTRCPSRWRFEASADNVSWTVLPYSKHEADVTVQMPAGDCTDFGWVKRDAMHPPSTICRWGCPNTLRYRYYRWQFLEPDVSTFSGSSQTGYLLREARIYSSSQPDELPPETFNTPARQGIPGEHFRIVEPLPQLNVVTNNITAACIGNCSFGFTSYDFAVSTVSPSHANKGDAVQVAGSGFTGDTAVEFGGGPCDVSSVTPTQIHCVLGAIPGGVHVVQVSDPMKGYADVPSSASVIAQLKVTTCRP